MGFLIVLACAAAGFLAGAVLGDGALAGGVLGIAVGLVLGPLRALTARVDALAATVEALQRSSPDTLSARSPAPRDRGGEMLHPASAERPPSAPVEPAMAPTPFEPMLDSPSLQAPPLPPSPASPTPSWRSGEPIAGTPADPVARGLDAIRRWFTEGNVPVKVGMLVLFAGVAALLKYASDQGWLQLPVEFRLAGIALAAIAALAFGWRERLSRRSFALSLQGGAIGVLLMTVFAAFRLHNLMPAPVAFALMLTLVAGVGVLAVLQDAVALAVLGILAGFAAPILMATGSGDHVVLFSWYALLNLAIFAIAWVKPWRVLNLLSFAFTYAIGIAWGVLSYRPGLFASTEPFLLIHFAIYLAIPILYSRKREPRHGDAVDGGLLFGNPLIAFGLQAVLLEGDRMALAWSALGLAVLYALLAWLLRRRPRAVVLGEVFAVLALGFATLAVPLALSSRATACTFALEGAGLVWLGLRQRRWLPRLGGLVLQVLAAGAFVIALDTPGGAPAIAIANGVFISALLIALAGFISARLHRRSGSYRPLALALHLWALAWWSGAGLHEIDRFVAATLHPPAVLGWIALTAALAAVAAHRLRDEAFAWTAAVAMAGGVALVCAFAAAGTRPFAGWGLVAFPSYALAGFFGLYCLRESASAIVRVAHLGWLWTWTLAFALCLRQFAESAQLADGWRDAMSLLPVLAVWSLALLRPAWIAAPLGERLMDSRAPLLASQALVALVAFAVLLLHDGDSLPLPFVPLLNPIELVQVALLACAARWLATPAAGAAPAARRAPLLLGAGFAFVTAATLRATHHLAALPWDAQLWDTGVAQTSLTVVWSALGVFGWVIGSRRGERALWLAGAVLMAVVLVKLLLVDRSHLGNLFGIASFIAYGLLCSVIGYLAPAPPRGAPGAAVAARPTP